MFYQNINTDIGAFRLYEAKPGCYKIINTYSGILVV